MLFLNFLFISVLLSTSLYWILYFKTITSFVCTSKNIFRSFFSRTYSLLFFSYSSLSIQSISLTPLEVIRVKSTKRIVPIPCKPSECISNFFGVVAIRQSKQLLIRTSLDYIIQFKHWIGYIQRCFHLFILWINRFKNIQSFKNVDFANCPYLYAKSSLCVSQCNSFIWFEIIFDSDIKLVI